MLCEKEDQLYKKKLKEESSNALMEDLKIKSRKEQQGKFLENEDEVLFIDFEN